MHLESEHALISSLARIPKCYVLVRSAEEEVQRNYVARTIATVRLAKEKQR